ncbi:hypothetical protein FNV43_RR17744 [Rhamnella rubrinervis]|uniref:Aluminum-activated malate transporter n=1 Tax=Rhamnella rubrinervis TaxID=2594499 RepID=A0A8K0GVM4_9ROSA|nr:hypothetical protein FNV43_RR17744 [Rhamnella rubrinervis]
MAFSEVENTRSSLRDFQGLKVLAIKLWERQVVEVAKKAKKIGKEDPRTIIHSLKVAVALTLVSLFYYYQPLYDNFGVNAIWAVLTVVVVFEFSVGATLGKGFNRMLATLLAGALAIGGHHFATLFGERGEPILISTFVFIAAAITTFVRFFPLMKARYDYGLIIFILTFSLVSVSAYRDDGVVDIARSRLSTIIIGSCIAIFVCIFIFPVWIGEDLHNLVAANMEKLGNSLQGFEGEYFQIAGNEQSREYDRSFLHMYKNVLTTKSNEENMANLARWEPCHGPFRFRHPWGQYIKVGTLNRQCAYKIEALNSFLYSEMQTPVEIKIKIQESCTNICSECDKALQELAAAIKKMVRSSSANPHIAASKSVAESLKSLLRTELTGEDDVDLIEKVPVAAVALLLIDIVKCIENIEEAVHELASLASFKIIDSIEEQPNLQRRGTVVVQPLEEQSHHAITVNESTTPENGNCLATRVQV